MWRMRKKDSIIAQDCMWCIEGFIEKRTRMYSQELTEIKFTDKFIQTSSIPTDKHHHDTQHNGLTREQD